MSDRTKLEELSKELPERERRDLLEKITRRMRQEEREEILPVAMAEEERERLIREEIQRISWWVRFFFWLQGLLTGRTRKELFLGYKISQLKAHIRQKNSGLSGFATRDLTPRFAQRLFDLYSAAYPLMGIFRSFHFQPEFQQEAIVYLLQSLYAESRITLEELTPLEELEDIFDQSGSEEELRKLVLRRFADYLKAIPESLFEQLEEGLKPLLYLRGIVLFPYSVEFRQFNCLVNPDRLEDKYPPFQHAPVMLMLDDLERLYYAIYLCLKLEKDWAIHEAVLRFYLLRDRHLEESADELPQLVVDLARGFSVLVREVEEFNRRVPVMEIVKYYRRDPYYRLAFNIPRCGLKTIYTTTARAAFLKQLDDQLLSIKERVVDRKIAKQFGTAKLRDLYYYTREADPEGSRLDAPSFVHAKSLRLLGNFLVHSYKGGIQEAVHLASAYLLSNSRIAQTRLMQFASGLEELEAKIVLFDRTLAPDEDDGKTLARFRRARPIDLEEQKLYRSFIGQKNREARDLVSRGRDDLQGIRRTFMDLLTSPAESVKSILRTIHFYRGRNESLQQILKSYVDIISDFSNLLDQLLSLEKGS
jgi:hypothetical protein